MCLAGWVLLRGTVVLDELFREDESFSMMSSSSKKAWLSSMVSNLLK